jgi:hypothetical protein
MNEKRKSSKYVKNLGAYKYVKRFLDIVGSLLALILFSPVFLILAIIIKSRDGGSAFFAQDQNRAVRQALQDVQIPLDENGRGRSAEKRSGIVRQVCGQ